MILQVSYKVDAGMNGFWERNSLARLQIPIETATLGNGLRVVVAPDGAAPVVTVGVYYNIGFRLEPRGRSGFAHLFEHMMFQGSANAGKMMHIKLINSSGGVLNGSTHYDVTNYFEAVPSNALERVLWLEADRMRALKVDEENLRNQRDVVKEEVRVNVLNQPYGGFPWLDLPPVAYRNWHNAHNFYGDFADLDAATLDDVQAFFKTYYAPSNPRRLVLEKQVAVDTSGGIHYPMGDIFDYNGPTQMVTRILHKPEFSADQTLAVFDEAVGELQQQGISAEELEQVKVKFRSDYYSQLEGGRGGYMPRYGLMHCLACFTLFDRDPQLVNTILEGFLEVTPAQVQAAAQKYLVRRNRAIVIRRPVAKGAAR